MSFRSGKRSNVPVALRVLAFWVWSIWGLGCETLPPGRGTSAHPSQPQRIVSLSPNVTEILEGVGAFGRVVAVSDYCDYPPAVRKLPRVGGWQTTSLERVNSLQPDLVIMTRHQAPFVQSQLKALGFKTVVVGSLTLQDVFAAIDEIGRATGNSARAANLSLQIRRDLDEIRGKTRNLPKPGVLCVVDRVPGTLRDLYTATEGSFLAELIEIAGGKSIAPSSSEGYGRITKEAVVMLNPEVIIDMVQGAKGRLGEDPSSVWRDLPEVQAVREGKVFPLRDALVLHPSQFVADTARRFALLIHPEVFQHETRR